MAVVFIPHRKDDSYNFEQAKEFGPLKVLFDGKVNVHQEGFADLVEQKLEVLQDEDFIVMTGNHYILAVMVAFALRRYERVNLLLYSNRNDRFEPRVIKL